MGKIIKVFEDKLIPPEPDRNINRLFVYENQRGEVCIHFRNFKISLSSKKMEAWKEVFIKAEKEYQRREKMTYEI